MIILTEISQLMASVYAIATSVARVAKAHKSGIIIGWLCRN